MDPRLAERRRNVLEERARGGVRRVIWLVTMVTVVSALAWLLQSPWLSVSSIEVSGQQRADVDGALARAGLELGRPLLLAPADEAREQLLADPFIADATVDRLFPDTIEIRLIEYQPVAVVDTGSARTVIGETGVALARDADSVLPTIRLDAPEPPFGAAFEDGRVTGAASFFATLEPPHVSGALLFESEGELWVELGEYLVRLGRPIEMPQKAAALAAVLGEGQPAGAVINVIAPSRPTVRLEGGPQPSTND